MSCSAAHFPIAAFSSGENFSFAPFTDFLYLFGLITRNSLLTNGSTEVFTTSMREEGMAADNDPLGSGRSDCDVTSFCLKYLNIAMP